MFKLAGWTWHGKFKIKNFETADDALDYAKDNCESFTIMTEAGIILWDSSKIVLKRY
jgi:hypothetical protein